MSITFRLLDFFIAAFGLIFLSPLFLLILIVGVFANGDPIFRQIRLGRFQQPFVLFKFRTMSVHTKSVATHLVDPSLVTPFGKILRQTKLDELPQLLNVIKGDMSLVGPRPGLESQRDLTSARDALDVFRVKPGITGLAQINSIDMANPNLLARLDAKMVGSLSVKNYFCYLFLTVLGRVQGDRLIKK